MVRLSIGVQHHPSRAYLPERLRKRLGTTRAWLDDALVVDPEPDAPRNPWRTAREAWRRTPDSCTHRLVLQDDVIPCKGFIRLARAAIEARPDRITSFYLGDMPAETHRNMLVAANRCAAWVLGQDSSWCPALALCIPAELVPSLVEFDDGTRPIADDDVYGRWTRLHRYRWWATIPSLVDHDDDAPSLMRDPNARGRRVASCWIGDADPKYIDWTLD